MVMGKYQCSARVPILTHNPTSYAVVRKETHMPKPTPPARRKKFNNRLTDDRFATMPHLRRSNVDDENEEELPERPVRGYSTIGPPKPPRRKSLTAEDTQK